MGKYLRVGFEDAPYGSGTSEGEGEVNVSAPIKITSFSKTVSRNEMIEETTDAPLVNHATSGAYGVSGSLECLIRPTQIRPLLHGLMGELVEPALPAAEDYYELSDVVPLVFYLGENYVSMSYEQVLSGVGMTSSTFTFAAKEFVKCSLDFIAQKVADGVDDFDFPDDYSDEVPLTFYMAGVSRTDGIATRDVVYSKNVEFTLDRKLDAEQFYLESPFLGYLVATGAAELTGSITFGERQYEEIRAAQYGDFEATSLTDNAEDVFDIEIPCKNKSGDIVVTFLLEDVIFTEVSDNQTGKAEAEKTVNYRGNRLKVIYPKPE